MAIITNRLNLGQSKLGFSINLVHESPLNKSLLILNYK